VSPDALVLAIDQGTHASRALVHDADVDQVTGKLLAQLYDFGWGAPSSQTLRPNAG